MVWGTKFYNDVLMQSGVYGNVQTELLFKKDEDFSFGKGWRFPHKIYFNGDNCVMPSPDDYPTLPNAGPAADASFGVVMGWVLLTLMII